ncbi:hypothetical protein [Pseudomonas syringae group genomosp. 3]|uniref:hypothetical protein n=1 Tax=Pseudomonas syringae group genomosp. 3 TaxID=251701 RepID=UPI000EFF0E47|nr:hypothetical protein [Pseudomonas syringae group genomosp. 3]
MLNSEVLHDAQGHDGIPTIVATAMKIDFGVQISGYLICVVPDPLGMIGVIYGDDRGRFADGRSIRTSRRVASSTIEGYEVVQTLNSRCVICSWSGTAETFTWGCAIENR